MNKRFLAIVVAVSASAFAVAPLASNAATTQDHITVSATVTNVCIVTNSSDAVSFGTYDPIVANATTDDTATYTASWTCTAGDAAFTYSFSSATGSNGSNCEIVNGSTKLNYTVSDGTHADYCATGKSYHAEPTAIGTQQTQAFTFDLLQGQTTAIAGNYTDTNTATITP